MRPTRLLWSFPIARLYSIQLDIIVIILAWIKIVLPFHVVSIIVACTDELPATLLLILTKLLNILNITTSLVLIRRLPRSRNLGRTDRLPPDPLVNLIALGRAICRVKRLLHLAPNAQKVLVGHPRKFIGLCPIHSCILVLSCGGEQVQTAFLVTRVRVEELHLCNDLEFGIGIV